MMISYSLLAMPMAIIVMPIYLHLASFYLNIVGLPVIITASILIIGRIFDCITDPIIGYYCDYLYRKKITRIALINFLMVILVILFYFLFNPPLALSQYASAIYLAIILTLFYFTFSALSINYEALAVDIAGNDSKLRNKLISCRESFQVVGTLLSAILPTIIIYLNKNSKTYDESLSQLWLVALLFMVPSLIAVNLISSKIALISSSQLYISQKTKFLLNAIKNRAFLNLLFIYLINSIGVAIPALLIRFYVEYYLLALGEMGNFLGLYFLSAIIGIPFWNNIAKRFSIIKAWRFSIALSVVIFIFTALISRGDSKIFYFICLFSGFAMGCDLIAPQIILTTLICKEEFKASYFAIFSFIAKLALAIATFISFILIAKDYSWLIDGGKSTINIDILPIVYCLTPCLIKIITFLILPVLEKNNLSIKKPLMIAD